MAFVSFGTNSMTDEVQKLPSRGINRDVAVVMARGGGVSLPGRRLRELLRR